MTSKKVSKENLIPLGDRVLVRPVEETQKERKLPSGIILPESVSKDKTDKGIIVATGEGRVTDEGKKIPMKVKVGQTVLFQWGDKFEIGGVEHYLVSESNILAVVKK